MASGRGPRAASEGGTTPVRWVAPLAELDRGDLPLAGGKGANLGALIRAGFPVPEGFCVLTDAFGAFLDGVEGAREDIAALSRLSVEDAGTLRSAADALRARLERAPMPDAVAAAVRAALRQLGGGAGVAVRSSATAEDLPGASFAGQQDTFLNVRGEDAVVDAVRRCWASLFTERAVAYRQRNGFDHADVALAVVVQRMVRPSVSGILFTADPVHGTRSVAVVDAGFGLGEALVSGVVSADRYRVDRRTGAVIERSVSQKRVRIDERRDGGVERRDVPAGEAGRSSLDDAALREIVALGDRVEAHFGTPQDIEWSLAGGSLVLLQARPITSLFPVPRPAPADGALHLYFSFGHAQGLTEPMSTLGRSVWRLLLPFGRPPGVLQNPYVVEAADRLYLDVSPMLRHRVGRRVLPVLLANADPLAPWAVRRVAARPDFRARGDTIGWSALRRWLLPSAWRGIGRLAWRDTRGAVADATALVDDRVARVTERLGACGTPEARLRAAVDELDRVFVEAAWLLPPYVVGGILGYHLLARLAPDGHAADVDAVRRGLAGNVTSEMDLAVGDLADEVRGVPGLAQVLGDPDRSGAERLRLAAELPGADAFLRALGAFLERYGMRGPAEIDLARPRWRDEPASLLAMVCTHLEHDGSGEHRRRHAALAEAGEAAARRLVAAARRGPLGWARAPVVARLARVARTLPAVREHPKFLLVRVLALVRPVLLEVAATLVDDGRLARTEDVWWVSVPELLDAVERGADLRATVAERRADAPRWARMRPPRLITSEGEIPSDAPADDRPGLLRGSAVSPGVVEGTVRVVLDPARATLRPGEILVAPFTDPGWTPLFVRAGALVMEVGGLMTHGSVVAREMGIPAVVGVDRATERLATGARVRVDGGAGTVEVLGPAAGSRAGAGAGAPKPPPSEASTAFDGDPAGRPIDDPPDSRGTERGEG